MPAEQGWRRHVELATAVAPDPQQPVGAVCLEALPEPLALLRLQRGVPECVRSASRRGHFTSVVQEPSHATAWVPRSLLPRPAELADREGAEEAEPGVGWAALCIGRPGSGTAGLKVPAAPGTAGTLSALLAEVPLGCKLLSSTGTEVLLLREANLCMATAALVTQGHALWPAQRVCDPRPWEAAKSSSSQPDLLQKQAGAWSLVQREQPLGTIVEDHTEGDGPLRLQSSTGLFIDIRIPAADSESEFKQASCGGRCHTACLPSGQVVSTQLRQVDFQPPGVFASQFQVTLSSSSMECVEHPNPQSRELWARIGEKGVQGSPSAADCCALELQSEVPEPAVPRTGIWIFVGKRFARVTGLARGRGLVGNTCCRSLSQLSRLRGPEVQQELAEHYEAITGTVEKPGLLRISRHSSRPEATGSVFHDALDDSTGDVLVGKECIVHILPSGRRETWRILEWTYDPFSLAEMTQEEEASANGDELSDARPVDSTSPGAKAGAKTGDKEEKASIEVVDRPEEAVAIRSDSPAEVEVTTERREKAKKPKKEKKSKKKAAEGEAKTKGGKSKEKGSEKAVKGEKKKKKKQKEEVKEPSEPESPLPELEDPEDDEPAAPVQSDAETCAEAEEEASQCTQPDADSAAESAAPESEAAEAEEDAEEADSPPELPSPSPQRKKSKKVSKSPKRKRRRSDSSMERSPAKRAKAYLSAMKKKKAQRERSRSRDAKNHRSERGDKAHRRGGSSERGRKKRKRKSGSD